MVKSTQKLNRAFICGLYFLLATALGTNPASAQNSTATIRVARRPQPLLQLQSTGSLKPVVQPATFAIQADEDEGNSAAKKRNTLKSPSDRVDTEQNDDARRAAKDKSDELNRERDAETRKNALREKAAQHRKDTLEKARERAKERENESESDGKDKEDRKQQPKFSATDKIRNDFQPITALSIDIREQASKHPENRSVVFVGGYPLADSQKSWNDRTLLWEPTNLAYNPLYFQETQLERYGQSASPLFQSFFSGAVFVNRFVALPVNVLRNSPNACVFPVNYPNPGECVPFQYPTLHCIE